MAEAKSHEEYMRLALSRAKKSPPKPTNYCVGAVLVSPSAQEPILATGYTLELPGTLMQSNAALASSLTKLGVSEEDVGKALPEDAVLYTTMEPCNVRLSGNLPCVDRILQTTKAGRGIRNVYIGVKEPEKFVGQNQGRRKLEEAGVKVIHVGGMEDEILKTATAGHTD